MPHAIEGPMQEYDLKMMALAIALPFAFGLLCLLFPRRWNEPVKWFALFGAAATLTLGLCLLVDYYAMIDSHLDPAGKPLHSPETSLEWRMIEAQRAAALPVPGPRLSNDWVARYRWIESLGIDFAVGLDGISMFLIILTAFVTLFAVIAAWNVERNTKFFLALTLFFEAGSIGSLLATDLFLFFGFLELTLVPIYLLVALWGQEKGRKAGFTFAAYQLAGSACLLIALAMIGSTNVRDFVDQNTVTAKAEEIQLANPALTFEAARGRVVVTTFDMATHWRVGRTAAVRLFGGEGTLAAWKPLADQRREPDKHYLLGPGATLEEARNRFGQPIFQAYYQYALFFLLLCGFAVKVPINPVHRWLPDLLADAPVPVAMLVVGILLPAGGYGLFRLVYPLAPNPAQLTATGIAICLVAGLFSALGIALATADLKRRLAYISVVQMAYVALGLFAANRDEGLRPWALAMSGAAFQMLSQGISMAGLFFAAGVLDDRTNRGDIGARGGLWNDMPRFGALCAILVLAAAGIPGTCGFLGLFPIILGTWSLQPFCAVLAILGCISAALLLLVTWQRFFLGVKVDPARYADVDFREGLILAGFAVPAVILGVYPTFVLSWLEPTVTNLAETLGNLK